MNQPCCCWQSQQLFVCTTWAYLGTRYPPPWWSSSTWKPYTSWFPLEEKTGTRKWPGIDQLMRKGLTFSEISLRPEPKSVKSLSRRRVLINLSKNAVSKLHFIAALKEWVTTMTGDNSHAWLQTDSLPSVFKDLRCWIWIIMSVMRGVCFSGCREADKWTEHTQRCLGKKKLSLRAFHL